MRPRFGCFFGTFSPSWRQMRSIRLWLIRQQLFNYAEDIARLYEVLKTGYSKDELEDRIKKPEAFAENITNNKEMLTIFLYIESIAQTSQPVLITGETGVGKELIAGSIHSLSGLKGRFITVNVAGLDDNLFSEIRACSGPGP